MINKLLQSALGILILSFVVQSSKFASIGQFPWHVSIEIEVEDSSSSYNCEGTLISNKWILTSANCLEEAKNVTCNFGTINQSSAPKLRVSSTNFILHPDFSILERDIALIRLPRKIQFTEHIKPILLPKRSMTYENLINKNCTIIGFVEEGSSKNLKFTKLRILSKEKCPYLPFQLMSEDSMCASSAIQNQNICIGDSGSGLVLKQNNKFYLIGINSLQTLARCANKPIIFQSVQMNLDWISRTTGIKIDKN